MSPTECPVRAPDRTIAVLRDGYEYLLRLRGGDSGRAAAVRLLGRPAVVVGGPDGARLFYDTARMRRRRAVPAPLAVMLFGRGAVHGLDGAAHTHRKAMFLQLLTGEAAETIAAHAAAAWPRALGDGEQSVFDTAVRLHCDAVCRWAGVPPAVRPPWLAGALADMVDGFGSVGRRHVRGWRARLRTDRWARRVVRSIREGTSTIPDDAAAAVIARASDEHGRRLPVAVAAVELINVLRPTVAVAYFVAFTALALDDPSLRSRMATADEAQWEAFAHELRRVYPFVPMLAARALGPLNIGGCPVRRGQRVVLDVYGTLHDPHLWREPDRFDIDRFVGGQPDPFGYLPQGGGEVAAGHRCPGERVAIELIKTAGRFLSRLDYQLDAEDRDFPLSRMPTRPRSGVRIRPAGMPASSTQVGPTAPNEGANHDDHP